MAAPNDISDEEDCITVRVYINRQYEKTHNFDITQDVWKLAELDKESIEDDEASSIQDLRDDIPKAFRNSKSFKPLFLTRGLINCSHSE